MNKLIKTMIFFFLCLNLSCAKIPWENHLYTKETIPRISNYSVRRRTKLPNRLIFRKSYINGAFLNVSIDTRNWGGYSRKGPYRIGVSLYTDKKYLKATINSIEIISLNKNNIYSSSEITLPTHLEFDSRRHGYCRLPLEVKELTFKSGALFNFEVLKEERIKVKINITFNTKEKNETKSFEYNFKPEIEKGLYRFIM